MLFRDVTLADGRGRDVRVEGNRITAVESCVATDEEETVDGTGYHLLPGAIDVHVHFRAPGHPHKENWTTGPRAAAAGGVTTVVDQPNTEPPTVTGSAFDTKAALAEKSLVNYGLNGGVTAEWEPDALFKRPLFALGEVFLADSTGDLGIDTSLFERAVERAAAEGVTVTVHAEDASLFDPEALRPDDSAATGNSKATDHGLAPDAWSAYRTPEAEVAAVEQAVRVGATHDAAVHIAHTSTPDAIDALAGTQATCEVTPHHLLLSRSDLPELGTFGRMNPPLRHEQRRKAVFDRVRDGGVDLIATDHAPHTTEEKDVPITQAPSGVPGVETMLPLLLSLVHENRLSLTRVRDLTAKRPAEVFDIPRKGQVVEGYDADLVLVDLDTTMPIRGDRLHSKVSWTPFEGWTGVFPELTMVRGQVVYDSRDGNERFGPAAGCHIGRS